MAFVPSTWWTELLLAPTLPLKAFHVLCVNFLLTDRWQPFFLFVYSGDSLIFSWRFSSFKYSFIHLPSISHDGGHSGSRLRSNQISIPSHRCSSSWGIPRCSQGSYKIWSPQQATCLPWDLLPVGHTWYYFTRSWKGNILARCPTTLTGSSQFEN